VATLGVCICAFCIGSAIAYTSPALPSMTNGNVTSFSVSAQEASWVGGIMPLTALVGGLLGGQLILFLGTKRTGMLAFVPFFTAWMLIANAKSVIMVLAGRALSGLGVGVATLAFPLYMGEAMHPSIRGVLGMMPTLVGNFAILLCYIMGSYTNWSQLAFICSAFCVPFIVILAFVPESPRWYLARNKPEKARAALTRLRRKDANIDDEMNEMLKGDGNGTVTMCKEMFQKKYFRPVFIAVALMVFQQLSGINALMFYTVMIFNMSGSTIDSYVSTMIVGFVNFLATVMATIIIDLAGRKILLFISAVSMIITLFVLSIFFYLKARNYDTSSMGWVPLTSFVLYVLGFSVGFGPIPWLMMGEILPNKIRGPSASLVVGSGWSCTFIVTKTFQDLIDCIGIYGAFCVFCVFCILALIFVIFVVPETKNKSLEQIEEELTGG
ncbi:hypothetical protein KR044_001946, partial [Drosophila immigrans]